MEHGFQGSWSSASRVFDKASSGTSKRGRTCTALPAASCTALVARELLKSGNHTVLPKGPGSMEEGLKDRHKGALESIHHRLSEQLPQAERTLCRHRDREHPALRELVGKWGSRT